jgi:hypothetical protein
VDTREHPGPGASNLRFPSALGCARQRQAFGAQPFQHLAKSRSAKPTAQFNRGHLAARKSLQSLFAFMAIASPHSSYPSIRLKIPVQAAIPIS